MAQLLRGTYQLPAPAPIRAAHARHLDKDSPPEVPKGPILLGLVAGNQHRTVAPTPNSTPLAGSKIRRQSPKVGAVCVNAPVRICAGGVGQPAFLPRSPCPTEGPYRPSWRGFPVGSGPNCTPKLADRAGAAFPAPTCCSSGRPEPATPIAVPRSLPITANQPFGQWHKVFPEPAMTVAASDRRVHRAIIFKLADAAPSNTTAPGSAQRLPRSMPQSTPRPHHRHRYVTVISDHGYAQRRATAALSRAPQGTATAPALPHAAGPQVATAALAGCGGAP